MEINLNVKTERFEKILIDMEKEEIKKAMLGKISEELDMWFDRQEKITDGYEYEEKAIASAQNISRILISQSRGELPKSRNKKNSKPVLESLK